MSTAAVADDPGLGAGTADTGESPPALATVYAESFELVWCALRRFGVPLSQLDDATHDVFLVVERRLPEFEGRSSLKTWLYAISLRVAQHHRSRAVRRGEEPLADDAVDLEGVDPHAALERAEAVRELYELLDLLDDDQRVVFVMVELEELPVPEVSRIVGAPLNTVYSRLRLARRAFERALGRRRAKTERKFPWRS